MHIRRRHNTHRCLEIYWNDSWGLLGLVVDLEIEVHIAGLEADGDEVPEESNLRPMLGLVTV